MDDWLLFTLTQMSWTLMQKRYNLTYSQSIDAIINNQNPGEVKTGNANVKIYIYPGLDIPGAIKSAQSQFQSGDYDIFAAVFNYSSFANALSGVESSLNKDIKIIGTASIEAQTATGFSTLDPTGDTILNAAVINPLNVANGICASIMKDALVEMKQTKEYLVCIDSDGCLLDNMELKHKECFCPATVNCWNLQGASKYVREVAEFVNLYSRMRGFNRFPAIIRTLELSYARPQVRERGLVCPDLEPLKAWHEAMRFVSQ